MVLLDGASLSKKILESLRAKLDGVKTRPNLGIILVGDDPASLKYVNLKMKACDDLRIPAACHHLPAYIPELELVSLIRKLNDDPQVTGFFIQLPLPPQFDKHKILNLIDPSKDVDGLTPNSPFTPAVVKGVVRLLDEYRLLDAEKTAVIINDSELIGRPLNQILKSRGIKTQIADINTKNLPELTRGVDLVISATGVKGLITADYIKPGAIVVDIGGGDVSFSEVSPKTSYITPTFGGVGPMTIASLLDNLCDIVHG